MRESTPARLSVQLYRFLVNCYPSQFRLAYGDLMVQVFRDCCLQAQRQNSRFALIWLWGHTLVDALLSMIEQYSNRGVEMTKKSWIRLSGWIMAASGILLLISMLASSRPDYNEYNAASWPIDRVLNVAAWPVMLMGALFLIIGILGLMTRFISQSGRLGQSGLLISLAGAFASLIGIAGLSISDSGPWWETVMLGWTGVFFGLILFGICCSQQKLFSHWNSLPLLTSTVWPLLILFTGLYQWITDTDLVLPGAAIGVVMLVTFGGLGLLGYLLQADTGLLPSKPA